ncbi:SOS response-associated peptidase [Polaribacter atrinae]|uniref:SOS response-associated peptidase n=1 Tax=Polaribacter atrinae TaxID=1333662 RepID=UPI0024921DB1|nr:SOS response-associated peptidase family protein [Polaribacter atrinae]
MYKSLAFIYCELFSKFEKITFMCYHISLLKKQNTIEAKMKAIYKATLPYQPYYHFNGWEKKHLSIIKQNDLDTIDFASWGVLPTNYNLTDRTAFLAKTNTLNATKERLFSSTLYQQFIIGQKCIILADGFFEPHASTMGEKIPFYFKEKSHNLIAFAGIYSEIAQKGKEPNYSASIITTEANAYFKEIHNKPNVNGSYRMPLILDPSNYKDWLTLDTKGDINGVLETFTQQEIISYPVSKKLFSNKIDTNVPGILDRVEFQRGLF